MKVWGNYVRDLPKKLDKTLTASMTNGWGVDRTVKAMMKNIDSGLRNRMTTLVQTEMAHLADEASQLAYERKGVKEYEWLATLELHTCELCGNFDGQTFIVGSKNAKRPIVDSHPNCRCTTVPSVNFPGLKRWSRDPITGKGKRIDSMSFNDWKEKYTDSSMLKKARNSSSDKKQYDRYKSILGDKYISDSFDKFQQMKYNGGSEWDKYNRKVSTISEIQNKPWNQPFKDKTLDLYTEFYENGVEFSSHSLGRYAQRTDLSVDDALIILNQKANYLQEDGRKVWFYDGHAFVKNKEETEVVTYVYRKNKKPKGGEKPWKLI
ncbi:minor capsid protein [Vagococcus sp.]|uniref:minor capsid protein n=1 Tax=Vagococcus sp. TaxID=1933889 RepID=UPI003F96A934